MMRRAVAVLVVLAGVAGCGVSSEDRPQPIGSTTSVRTSTVPSATTSPEPATTSPTTSPTAD